MLSLASFEVGISSSRKGPGGPPALVELDPGAGSHFVVGFEILELGELLARCSRPKARGCSVVKEDSCRLRGFDRCRQTCSPSRETNISHRSRARGGGNHRSAGGWCCRRGTSSERRDADALQVHAREQRVAHVHYRLAPRRHREPVGASDRAALQQRVDDDGSVRQRGLLDPELRGTRGIPRLPARRLRSARPRADNPYHWPRATRGNNSLPGRRETRPTCSPSSAAYGHRKARQRQRLAVQVVRHLVRLSGMCRASAVKLRTVPFSTRDTATVPHIQNLPATHRCGTACGPRPIPGRRAAGCRDTARSQLLQSRRDAAARTGRRGRQAPRQFLYIVGSEVRGRGRDLRLVG